MPLGWRVHRKIEQIIREEMDAIGGAGDADAGADAARALGGDGPDQDPGDLPRRRIARGRRFILPMTHEETVTFHAREIQSYKELPQLWYHFQTKDRDEPRPSGGLLRVREFIMKDAYSFDRDEEGVRRQLRGEPRGATRRSSRAASSRPTTCRPRAGSMGGKFSVDFLAPSGSGENTLVTLRERRLRRRPRGRARRSRARRCCRSRSARREEVETPGVTTIEALAEFLEIDAAATSKAMPVVKDDGTLVLALVRGDDRLSETKLFDALAGDVAPGDRRRDPRRVRRLGRLARPGRVRRRGRRRRDAARGRVRRRREPRRLAPARRRGRARLRAALRRPPRAAGGRPLPGVRRRAPLPDRDRGRATSSTSARSTRGRSRRRSSTRTARRSRCSAAATGSGPAG